MYSYRFLEPAKKEFDGLDVELQKFLIQELEKRCEDPYKQPLKADLKGFFKISCKYLAGYKKVRLIYRVIDLELIIEVVSIGKKPNVYSDRQILKRLQITT